MVIICSYPITPYYLNYCVRPLLACAFHHLFYHLCAYPGIGEATIVEEVLHGDHTGIVAEEHTTEVGTIFGTGITEG